MKAANELKLASDLVTTRPALLLSLLLYENRMKSFGERGVY
jgi:hypothetical protein